MNELKIFENPDFGAVRTIEDNGKVLFCGSDVANALGYVNSRKALADHCKGVTKRDTLTSGYLMLVKSFTDELAWDIQRTLINAYFKVKEPPAQLTGYELIAAGLVEATKLLEESASRINALHTEIAVKDQQINELQPKADYYNVVLNCTDLMPISEIAKDYGKSAKWLNDYLHTKGVQFRQGKIWLLYQRYAQRGYTSTKTYVVNGSDGLPHTKIHTHWTQKDRLFIYDLLKSDGILPIVEMTA